MTKVVGALLMMLVWVVLPGHLVFGEELSSPAPAVKTAEPEAVVEVRSVQALSPELEGLLDRIEKRGVRLKSFQAQMTYRVVRVLLDDITEKTGNLYYQAEDKGVHFRIQFTGMKQWESGEGPPKKAMSHEEDIAFDGRWVTTRNGRTKTIQHREVSRKPQSKEDFRLGHGTIPLPFAINKRDMLQEFTVAWLPAHTKDPPGCDHLHLTPRPERAYAKEYVGMDLWVSHQEPLRGVPVQFRFETSGAGGYTTCTWSKIKIDKPIKADVFELKPAGPGWNPEERIPLPEPTPPEPVPESLPKKDAR